MQMTVEQVESILDANNPRNWTIKGDHLCYQQDNTNFLFDKIKNSGFLAFNKLVLVSNGRIIPMSFFIRKRLHRKVLHMLSRVKIRQRREAMEAMEKALKPKPIVRQSEPRTKVNKAAVVNNFLEAGMFGLDSDTISARLQDMMGNLTQPTVPNEGQLAKEVKGSKKMVKKAISEVEQKSETFRENVEKEKARIRKLLRKGTGDSGPK